MIEVRAYQREDGKRPLYDWLYGLDKPIRGAVRQHLNCLRLGNFGASKSLRGGLFEIRIHRGSGYRVYYGKQDKTVIILLCGGDKRSQKRDITRARDYWRDYRASC